jgi:hypothetical protein
VLNTLGLLVNKIIKIGKCEKISSSVKKLFKEFEKKRVWGDGV